MFALTCMAGASRANSPVVLPAPLDRDAALVERYWTWLKAEVGAPTDLPWPMIEVAPLPSTVRMAFVFPTEEVPWHRTRIVISPRSVDRATGPDRLMVLGELAHEMVHYVLLLAENRWDVGAEVLHNDVHHHCDREFMRLTRRIADFIWETYHSADTVRAIDYMVHQACWRDGHFIGGRRLR